MTNAALTVDRTVPNVGINGFGRIGMYHSLSGEAADNQAEPFYDAA